MISIIVERTPGDRQTADVVDSLINTEEVARARGQSVIDENCSNRIQVSGSGPYTGWLEPGRLAETRDAELGSRRGMVRDFTLSISIGSDSFTADADVVLEQLDE